MAVNYTIAQVPGGTKTLKNLDYTKKPGKGILVLRVRNMNFDALATSSGVALAHTDTYKCIPVNPGETVIAAGINNLVVATAASTMDLDFAAGDHFLDGQAANDVSLPTVTDGYTGGPMHITSRDTIDVKEASGAQTLAGATVQVWALIARMSKGVK